jgi:hypothetical protein
VDLRQLGQPRFPGFWVFLISRILGVRLDRRWYATVFTVTAAIPTAICVLNMRHLLVLGIAAVADYATICLAHAAVGGRLSCVSLKEDENKLRAYMTAANIGSGGLRSAVGGEMIQHLPMPLVAFLLAGLIALPISICVLIPAPGRDRRLASMQHTSFRLRIGQSLTGGATITAG